MISNLLKPKFIKNMYIPGEQRVYKNALGKKITYVLERNNENPYQPKSDMCVLKQSLLPFPYAMAVIKTIKKDCLKTHYQRELFRSWDILNGLRKIVQDKVIYK